MEAFSLLKTTKFHNHSNIKVKT